MIQGTGSLDGDRGLLEACWQLFDFRAVPKSRVGQETTVGEGDGAAKQGGSGRDQVGPGPFCTEWDTLSLASFPASVKDTSCPRGRDTLLFLSVHHNNKILT